MACVNPTSSGYLDACLGLRLAVPEGQLMSGWPFLRTTAVAVLTKGDPGRLAAGQNTFHHRARLNGLARSGRYAPAMEQIVA